MKAIATLFALTLTVLSCTPPEDDKSKRLLQMQGDVGRIGTKILTVKMHLDLVQIKMDGLKSTVGDFSDGFTNWKDIVPHVESETKELDENLNDLEESLDELKRLIEAAEASQ